MVKKWTNQSTRRSQVNIVEKRASLMVLTATASAVSLPVREPPVDDRDADPPAITRPVHTYATRSHRPEFYNHPHRPTNSHPEDIHDKQT
jgi:hypothetical protein